MSENSEMCPLYFLRTEGDIFKCLVLSKQLTAYFEKLEQQNVLTFFHLIQLKRLIAYQNNFFVDWLID